MEEFINTSINLAKKFEKPVLAKTEFEAVAYLDTLSNGEVIGGGASSDSCPSNPFALIGKTGHSNSYYGTGWNAWGEQQGVCKYCGKHR